MELEDTEVAVFNAQGGQVKVTKNSKCKWKLLEDQSGMTHLVFSVDEPVGAACGNGVRTRAPNNRTDTWIEHRRVGRECQR